MISQTYYIFKQLQVKYIFQLISENNDLLLTVFGIMDILMNVKILIPQDEKQHQSNNQWWNTDGRKYDIQYVQCCSLVHILISEVFDNNVLCLRFSFELETMERSRKFNRSHSTTKPRVTRCTNVTFLSFHPSVY